MSSNPNTEKIAKELFFITFPGTGTGGLEALRRVTTPGTSKMTDSDIKCLEMLIQTEMLVVSRGVLAEAQNQILGGASCPPQLMTLHVNGTQKLRDLVYGYLTGNQPFDSEIWEFLVDGGYFTQHPAAEPSEAPIRARADSVPVSAIPEFNIDDYFVNPDYPRISADALGSGRPSAFRVINVQSNHLPRFNYFTHPLYAPY